MGIGDSAPPRPGVMDEIPTSGDLPLARGRKCVTFSLLGDLGRTEPGYNPVRGHMGQTLVYKRTHSGDPNTSGTFGCDDCMGQVRDYRFDAVIGVGGKRPDPGSEDIALKINWIGIDPTRKIVPPNVRRRDGKRFRGPWVTFKCFRLWEETGRDLNDVAPRLFKRMFEEKHVRLVMSRSLPLEIQEEVQDILALVKTFQPSRPSRVFQRTRSTKRKC